MVYFMEYIIHENIEYSIFCKQQLSFHYVCLAARIGCKPSQGHFPVEALAIVRFKVVTIGNKDLGSCLQGSLLQFVTCNRVFFYYATIEYLILM